MKKLTRYAYMKGYFMVQGLAISTEESRQRYGILDTFRGFILLSMIAFHSCWDLVYIFDMKWNWYKGVGSYIWQQSICWSFIFLSGFCWSLGRRHLKRGLLVFGAGALVSIVTILLMPENRVVFGVLTLIGTCSLCMTSLDKVLQKVPAWAGALVAFALFFLTKNINQGYLGFEPWNFIKLPRILYNGGIIMTFVGFTDPEFYSTDYFSLFPWIFLFMTGYFTYRMIAIGSFLERYFTKKVEPFSFLGRNSLLIYILHQPVVYGMFLVLDGLKLI